MESVRTLFTKGNLELRRYIIGFFLLVFFMFISSREAFGDSQHKPAFRQHEIEFALLLQLVNFIEWPEGIATDTKTMKIGICGTEENVNSLANLLSQSPKSGKIEIIGIAPDTREEILNDLNILFLSKKKDLNDLCFFPRFQDHPILLVGSGEGFLESGGMVSFVEHRGKVAFDINIKRGKEIGITFRAKLLRLARKIIDK